MIQPFSARADGWPHGPRRVVLVGPPGTGKTRSAMTAWLVPALSAGVSPRDVLACSFTNAAADEIVDRLVAQLGGDEKAFRWTSTTIHSEAYRLVREVMPGVKGPKKERDLAPDEVEDDAPDEDADLRRAARTVWDFARSTLAPGDTIEERLEAVISVPRFASDRRVARHDVRALAAEVASYETEKRTANRVDFTDMLELALERGEVPGRELVVVDEAQDLSPLQWLVVASWAKRARVVVLIGDGDQAIHRWCGADANPIRHYAAQADWVVRRLDKSHRVPRLAHAMARALILRDPDRMDAPYEPADHDGEVLEGDHFEVVQVLDAAVRQGRDVLVLGRAKRLLASGLAATMARNGIPYLCDRGRGYSPLGAPSANACARALVALRAGELMDLEDVRALLQALPARGFFPSRQKKTTQVAVNEWPAGCRVPVAAIETLGMTLGPLLEGDLCDALRFPLEATEDERDRPAQLALLVERWGREVLRERGPADRGITLTTMHASKGREADTVVLDLAAPKPVARAIAELDAVPDERRLLYVAITRTRDQLLLVRSPGDLGDLLELGCAPVSEAVA